MNMANYASAFCPKTVIAKTALTLVAIISSLPLGSTNLRADTLAYAYVPSGGGGNFGVFDLNTGTFTSISTPCSTCDGLAAFNGNLYGGGGTFNVYQLNPSNGASTFVGATGFPTVPLGSSTSGLYFVGWNVPNPNAGGALGSGLFSMNPATGAVTVVGSLGLGQADGLTALSTSNDSNALFYVFSSPTIGTFSNQALYELNPTTGAATFIGDLNQQVSGIMYEDGTLWAALVPGGSFDTAIGTINTTTAAETTVVLNPAGAIQSLAPDPLTASTAPSAAPEPASLLVVVGGVIVVGSFAKRRLFA